MAAYSEGRQARISGLKSSDCPHRGEVSKAGIERATPEMLEGKRGWRDENDQIAGRVPQLSDFVRRYRRR